jgi:hypothetical protein
MRFMPEGKIYGLVKPPFRTNQEDIRANHPLSYIARFLAALKWQ